MKANEYSRRFRLIAAAWFVLSVSVALARPLPADADQVTAPKWLDAPQVDGQCADAAYSDAPAGALTLADQPGSVGAQAQLLHSGQDFYICFSGLPLFSQSRALIRLDADHRQLATLMLPGTYEFSVTTSGAVRALRVADTGALEPLTMPASEFAAAVAFAANQTWSAELRVQLDWLGGYARTDGLFAAFQAPDGTIIERWPSTAAEQSPATWGALALTPIYPDSVTAGSAFMDGRGGYLVVPYAPQLNPREITIEGWVRVAKDGCGTLVGNGRAVSYWLALCQTIEFGYDGADSVFSGQVPLDNGWHHIAVSMDEEGVRSYYVDGVVDSQPGLRPREFPVTPEPEEIPTLGASDRNLRIGSDRDAGAGHKDLHGYVRELRIWNRIRDAQEIRATAFQNLSGTEPGLVALWPFTHGLQDIAGGHDAGRVGNASLAREAPNVTSFPAPPTIEPYAYPAGEPVPAWNRQIPADDQDESTRISIDGACMQTEYSAAARVNLESDRLISTYLLLGRDALYLCTALLFGQQEAGNAVTLYVDRSGQGGTAPGPAALSVQLRPDGTLAAGTGDGKGYSGLPPSGITNHVVTINHWHFQEDQAPFDAPGWVGEARIPLAALAPFRPGQPLRLALRYKATVPANIFPEVPNGGSVQRSWPASFDETRPGSWGVAATGWQLYLPLAGRASQPRLTEAAPTAGPAPAAQAPALSGAPAPAGMRSPPTYSDYVSNCYGPEDEKLSLATKPLALARMVYPEVKWRLVDSSQPYQRAEGLLQDITVGADDSWMIHDSNDVDMHLALPLQQRYLTVNGVSSLGLESETGRFPPNNVDNRQARPRAGDHMVVVGRWVYDCSHGHTELHPLSTIESDRLEQRPVGTPDGKFETVRVAHVWMNSNPDPYNATTLAGPFEFDLELPSHGGFQEVPFLRVVSGDPAMVSATFAGDEFHIKITPPTPTGAHFFELMVGELVPPNDFPAMSAHAYTVRLDGITILEDHDDKLTRGNGDWYLSININGTWLQPFWNTSVADGSDEPYDWAYAIPTTGGNLVLQVVGYEGDSPREDSSLCSVTAAQACYQNDNIATGTWSLGSLEHLVGAPQQKIVTGDWVLHYHVERGGAVTPALDDPAFWGPRLTGEPNYQWPVRLGSGSTNLIEVPPPSAPAVHISRPGFITERPLRRNGITLFGSDVDSYSFSLDDFADVQFSGVPAGLTRTIRKTWPGYHTSAIPSSLLDVLGYRGAEIEVRSTAGAAGDIPYPMQLAITSRNLPPDWGEGADTGSGRLVDLVTPAPATEEIHDNFRDRRGEFEWYHERQLEMDWAWQHVRGDVDRYDIRVPSARTRPPNQPPCTYDVLPKLVVEADNMRLVDYAPFITTTNTLDSLTIADPNTNLGPDGRLYVDVQHPVGRRNLYRLKASWTDGTYFTPEQCDRVYEFWKSVRDKERTYPAAWDDISQWVHWKPTPGDPIPFRTVKEIPLYELGGSAILYMDQGTSIDAVISSPDARPIVTRLYDANDVLISESVPIDHAQGSRIPTGLFPQTRIAATGLAEGELYVLQVVPAFDTGATLAPLTRIGVSMIPNTLQSDGNNAGHSYDSVIHDIRP